MTPRVNPRRRGSYGIDAPFAPALLAVLAVVELVIAILAFLDGNRRPFVIGLFGFVFLSLVLANYLYTTLRGKFVVWDGLLDRLDLRGDERILDMGCGRGAVLLLAAQHLTTGRAVGVDLWRGGDQSGNSAAGTPRNPVAGGVAGRVGFATAGMTGLALGHRRL